MKIIHLTDTHLGYVGQKIYQRSPILALEKAVESINLEHSDAEMLIITGDLALPAILKRMKHLKRRSQS
ncbi:hypothetical protein JCM19239_2003 [Vibrio variabilis]|uniref:3',5'-cyclic-nucleotide phosphodiesterase n=1 Tax=Vibrio variabilis TaxID=990271 RepID=A0ABQ0J6Z1_9VIBR|nr:hypothetical protein JCM19239_2003 [Vibrio variabilis]